MGTDSERDSTEARLEQVLAKYLRTEEQGTPLDQQQLLAEHPDLAEELASFFRNRSAMQQLAEQMQPHQLSTVGSDQEGAEQSRQKLGSFGDYELESEIARGGMGVVYRARQKSLQRSVALKMVLAGDHASAAELARFRQEAEAAARLDHAHVVPVYEVGEHDGRRYYTMKLIEGGDLNDQLGRLRQDAKSAVRLVEQVARAVHFAHQHGILHRDLKPANILIDHSGEPHVADFGLARLTDSNAKMTQTGAALGTPGYMAPEQIRGDKLLTTGADVYSLGAILYVCLTGEPPFQGANAWEAMQKALDSDPPSPRSANPKIDRDLETICKKALERDPAQRYESAAALADDLSRWLKHEPIAARPAGPIRRGLKWVRRHPVWTALMGMAAAMLLVVGIAYLRERQTNDRAEGFLYRTLLALAEREWSADAIFNAREALAKCPEKRRGWEWAYVRRLCYVTPAHRLGDFPQPFADGGFSEDGSRMCAIDEAGIARVWDAATRREISQVKVTGKGQPRAALSPDGKQLAVTKESTVHVFQVDGKTEKWKWEGTNLVDKLAYSPSGKTLAVLGHPANTYRAETPPQKAELVLLDAHTGKVKLREPLTESKYSFTGWMSFVVDGRLFLFDSAQKLSADGQKMPTLLAFHADRGERLPDIAIPNPPEKRFGDDPIAVSPDGRLVAFVHPHGNSHVELRPMDDGTSTTIPTSPGGVSGLTFSFDSKRLAFFTSELNLDLDDFKLHETLPTFGPLAALAGKQQPYLLQALVVDVVTRKEVALLRGFQGRQGTLCFSPDGNTLMALGGTYKEEQLTPVEASGEILVWNVEERAPSRLLSANTAAIHDLAVSPDGKRIVTAHEDKVIRVWDAASGALLREISGHERPVKSLSFGNDPNLVLVADGPKVLLWNCDTGKLQRTFAADVGGSNWNISSAALRPDGAQIAIANSNNGSKVQVIDVASGKTAFEIEGNAQSLSYSPDGKLLAISYQFDLHGELKIVDTASGKVLHHFRTEQKNEFFRTGWGYLRATFSPDGRYLAAVGNIGGAHLYDVHSGKLLRKMIGQGTTVWDAAFTSDSGRLATSGYGDGTVKLWSVATGEEVHTMRGHTGNVTGLAFSPDDSRLFSADTSGTVRIWEAR